MKGFRYKLISNDKDIDFAKVDRCLYGVSVGTELKIDRIIDGYFWARENFSRCRILIGDSLFRFTIQIQSGCDAKSALKQSADQGERVLNNILTQIAHKPEVVRCSEIMKDSVFYKYKKNVENLYADNMHFKSSLEDDALNFVRRQAKKGRLAIPETEAINISIFYLVEEIAIYSLLADQGWRVDVYLGQEVPTLAKIISGEIPDISGSLLDRVNVSIRTR
ncbi:tRNA-dependent cyclodipeptide synthase [Caballeronia sp. GACF4]|uniref:tRNA-dependent cyclodipeptide synthase n=1 Tax=Caballeronia sp. GACF4 TaxID=2921763 RepID=UPI0020288BF6|nr:tRNA-dependent cyclodipeptide synthase [Caballeronia sp. GACF4]